MARIALSDEQWADMMDVDDVTSGRRKALLRAVRDPEVDGIGSVDITLAFLLKGWSYADFPCPRWDKNQNRCFDLESIDELKAKDVDRLATHARAVLKVLSPDFDPNPDPETPTEPSGD